MKARDHQALAGTEPQLRRRTLRLWLTLSTAVLASTISLASFRIPATSRVATPTGSLGLGEAGPCNCVAGDDSQYGWRVQFGINLGVMLFPFGFPSVPSIPGGIWFGPGGIELAHNDADINLFSKSMGGGFFRVPRTIGLITNFQFNYDNPSCPEGEPDCVQQGGTCGVGFTGNLHPTVGQAYTVRIKKRCGWGNNDFTTQSMGSVDRSNPASSFPINFNSRSDCNNICETVIEVFKGASELGYGSRLTNFRIRCGECIRLD